MSSQNLLQKLQLTNENNLLIQGLPSNIEKHFIKLTFSKNVTPLLKNRGIDFALVFAVNQLQLAGILKEVLPVLQAEGQLWIAYPKPAAKISSDLSRNMKRNFLKDFGYEAVESIELDTVWTAGRFEKVTPVKKK